MPDITDLFPLATESTDMILARMQADLNAGIDPSDPLYADDLPGSVWDDLARTDGLEMDRIYDRMLTEVPMAALPTASTGQWLDMWADVVGLERTDAVAAEGVVTFGGADGTDVPAGAQVSTEAPTPDADPITFQVAAGGTIEGGTFDATVQAVDQGSQGNVAANAVTILDTPIDGVSVTNANAITGGADVESDEHLQKRVSDKLKGTNGAGNKDFYANLALNYPGVGFVTVQPNTPADGHVTLLISDINYDPAPTSMVDGLQEQLDPSATSSQGDGDAAIGATVIVTTPSALTITVAAAGLVLEDGYSLDGSGSTHDITPDVVDAFTEFFHTLQVGDDVLHNQALKTLLNVGGIVNVGALTLDSGGGPSAGDIAVDATHVAQLELPVALS